ncbi:MAG TPA: hypothetical protein VFU81_16880 [Thermomicrobiales bacterium]|nr:hypothetical protein [Thermomicrobiales bacterium]
MADAQFDRFVQQLARGPRSRRVAARVGGLGLIAALLRRGGPVAPGGNAGGLAEAAGTPAATPGACPGATAAEVYLDGAWLCRQRYALCTTAACQPSAHDPTIANCRCFVEDGYSIGYTSCRQRTPVGKTLVSTFSTQNVTSRFRVMICPERDRWANCLDVPCQIDPSDPTAALCPCPIVERGPALAFGGECDLATCSSVIWSAATPPGVTQFTAAMQCVNQPVRFPATCPNATPAASPGATPAGG